MYTPQEVQDKKFPKAVFGGYDMGEVDEFLDSVSSDYAALYKDNALLKNKMKVLADKVEEYRSVDSAMRQALIVAQKMASDMTEEAKAKSEEIRTRALKEYENEFESLKRQLIRERDKLETAKAKTKAYLESSANLCRMQMDVLSQIAAEYPEEAETAADAADEREDPVSSIDLKAIEIEKTFDMTEDVELGDTIPITTKFSSQMEPDDNGSREINVGGTNIKVFEKEFF